MSIRLNHRQIEAFRAVYRSGSMTAAGEAMGISQPAVSRLIKDLEGMIGLRLFNRQGTKITPTADASLLLQEVERSFSGLDRVARAAKELAQKRGSILRITTTYAISQFLLPSVLAQFKSLWPGVAVTLHTTSSPEIANLMEMQHYDLGITVRTPEQIGIEFEPLASIEAVCVMHASHPYAEKRIVTAQDLDQQPLLCLPLNSDIQPVINRILEQAGVAPIRVFETTFSSTICSLVARKVGLGIVDPFTARGFRHQDVICRPFKPAINYDLNLVFSLHRAQSNLTNSIIKLLREHLATEWNL
jgi:DNA-binding transcriptional LysR family regulator